ncbi:unnamed protein product [Ceutorhynchus assimilis]|uniref:C-CAP/cofactor C-like domain-containing protein n=1 Tax=Ceutorhynchus assimilis TaxID=467358 RepID=A0A9N9MQJ5_9CUCU|nr:unnamed protein product [Ceutorhynchus assimilis]
MAYNGLFSIYINVFTQYQKYSHIIGGHIFEQSQYVDDVFKETLKLVKHLEKFQKPLNQTTEQNLIEPILRGIGHVKTIERDARNHVFQTILVSSSVKIFEWVNESDEEKFLKMLNRFIVFDKQKAMYEIETLGRTHVEWFKWWNETYEELSIFILNFFKNGIVWSGQERESLMHGGDSFISHMNEERRAPLRQTNHQSPTAEYSPNIYQSSLITHRIQGRTLQNVFQQHFLQTAERPLIDEYPVAEGSLTRAGHQQVPSVSKLLPITENSTTTTDLTPTVSVYPRVFEEHDNKWLIENQQNSHGNLIVNSTKDIDISIRSCKGSTIVAQSQKSNIINLDNCNRVTILFRNASKLNIFNSKDCNLHCFETIPEVLLESCENCSVYLSAKSLDCSIITTKCANTNVSFPFEDGLRSFKIADHLITKIVPRKGVETTVQQ